jgi:outer membrane lipoprotein-sorting protein
VTTFEKALNALRSYKAEFIQYNGDGSQARGVFYMKRPNHLKFLYTEPAGSVILGKKGFLILYDATQDEEMTLDLENTPAKFLLQENISLSKSVKLQEFYQTKDRTVFVASDLDDTIQMTLFFDLNVEFLLGWQVKDIQGNLTTILLLHPEMNPVISEEIFLRTHKFKSKRHHL